MKSYLSLVPISARVHKRQSRMTRICIILAVFLVTSVFSMAEMWLKMEKTNIISKHGDYHVILQNVPDENAAQIRQDSNIAFSSAYGALNAGVSETNPDTGQNCYINGKNIVLYGVQEAYLTDIMSYKIEGTYPEKDNEIALSANAKELLGIDVGDSVVLNTQAGDFNFIVSAFYEDDAEFNQIIDGSCAYTNLSVFQNICSQNRLPANFKYYIRFTGERGLEKTIAGFKEQYMLTDESIEENTVVLGLSGASGRESFQNVYLLALICFVLILIAGILMISGCMNSTVAQRTSFFGMMRCIGASKRQIVRFVRLEALNWCKTAIPIGCLLATLFCWILCVILRFLVKGEWADIPLFNISLSGILCGIIVGLVTVFLAAHSPARQAAKVSPVAAVSGNTASSRSSRRGTAIRFFKVETSLGIHHATAAKKNLFLMTGSFALTIILFLAFSACFDIVRKLLPSESNFSPDIAIASQDNTNSIDRELAGEIARIPGVKNAFGTMYAISLPVKIKNAAGTSESETMIDFISYEEFMLEGTRKSIASGDLSKVYGDSGYCLTIFNQDSHLDVGDRIQIGDNQLEIACVASEGIGSVSGSPIVVCSEETFLRLMGRQGYMMINIILDKNAPETAVNEIRDLAGEHLFVDRREEGKEIYGSYWVFRIAAYGFLAVISFITVLNIMNSVSMGVSARIKQYGAMRAVGMESRQVTKMIMGEAATYAFCGTAVGLTLGLILHYLIHIKIVATHFGGTWKIPVGAIITILLLVSLSCLAAVYAPAKRIRHMAITATINEL